MAAPICIPPLLGDDRWGPVSPCRSFDFTIQFESAILSILPSGLLLIALAVHGLKKRRSALSIPRLSLIRLSYASIPLVIAFLLVIANVVQVAVVAPVARTNSKLLLLPAAILDLLATLLILLTLLPVSLSSSHHSNASSPRSVASSAFVSFYLFTSALFLAAQLRTSLLAPILRQHASISIDNCIRLALTVLLLYAVLLQPLNPNAQLRQQKASVVQRLFFLHLLPLLWSGRSQPIPIEAMDPMAQDANYLSARLYHAWTGTSSVLSTQVQEQLAYESSVGDLPLQSKEFNQPSMAGSTPSRTSSRFSQTPPSVHVHSYLKPASATDGSGLPARLPTGGQLLLAMFRASPGIFLSPIIPKAFFTLSTILKPIIVEKTLSFAQSYSSAGQHQPSQYGYGLVGAIGIVYLMAALAQGQYLSAVYTANCKVRGMLVQTVCLKSLSLSVGSMPEEESMSPTALMSVDVERIVAALDAFHEFWSALIVVPVATYLLYRIIGLAFVGTIVAIIISLSSIPLVARGIRNAQGDWSKKTDARVVLISTVIKNIRSIKMLAYESHVFRQLLGLRDTEVNALRTYCLRLIRISCFSVFSSELIMLATIATFSIMASLSRTNNFTPTNIFSAITVLSIVDSPLFAVSAKFAALLSAISSIGRIERFLNLDESPRLNVAASGVDAKVDPKDARRELAVFHNASLAWSSQAKHVLHSVNLTVNRGDRIAVYGRPSSGKSSLLCALLGEVNLHEGQMQLHLLQEKIGYMSQTPWICEALSIQENVVLGGELDRARFDLVCRACGLGQDLEQLPNGADTPARNLSGGQKQRVALCRAVYLNSEVLILDDPLSAVDAVTSRHIIKSVFAPGGLLSGKTVILATHSRQLQETCNRFIVVSEGAVSEVSSDSLARDHRNTGKSKAVDEPFNDGKDEIEAETAPPVEEQKCQQAAILEPSDEDTVLEGRVKLNVYKDWVKGAGIPLLASYFVLLLAANGLYYGELYYLQAWSGQNDEGPRKLHSALGSGLGSLVALQLVRVGTYGLASWLILAVAVPRGSRALHRAELYGLLCRPYAYFRITSPGLLINRFTQDLFVIDFEFTRAFTNFVFFLQDLILTLIIMVVPAPYLLVVIAGAGVFYYMLYSLYAPNSRHLRRLEMATKSPLHSHFAAMAESGGLLVVRASQQQSSLTAINARLLDRSQKPYFLLWQIRGWLQTWLYVLAAVLNLFLVLIAVLLRNSPNIGALGVALVSATSVANLLNFLLLYWTEAEIASVALERVHELSTLSTDPLKVEHMPEREPQRDESISLSLHLKDICATYTGEGGQNVLDNISLMLRAGERIGICGRSGSGKSTFLLLLLGMLKPSSGQYLAQDMDTVDASPHWLRQQASVVPQDPLIFPATLRENLDPGQALKAGDEEMWGVLRELNLAKSSFLQQDGLDANVGLETTTESQRQLINVARVLLKHPRLLILDEATSSMDHETDRLVQEALLRECRRSDPPLVISVAHRIDTIITYDRIVVLDKGRVAEIGAPAELLEIPNGIFRSYAEEQRLVK